MSVAGGLTNEVGKFLRVELAALGDVGIAANLTTKVEFRLAVLRNWSESGSRKVDGDVTYARQPD